jgi:hypothetical protein
MKGLYRSSYFLVLITFVLMIAATTSLAQVYKTVDEKGNVTYTDQPPADGSKPVDLPPISVVEAPVYEKPAPADAPKGGEDNTDGKQNSLRYLRKQYSDFAIVAPLSEESIWHPEDVITVAWNARYQLEEGMQVTIFVDGSPQSTGRDQIVPVRGLERGEHTVTAELKDARNRQIASAEPVTFFVRRPTINNRQARPRPRGNG